MEAYKIIDKKEISDSLFILSIEYNKPVEAGQFFMLSIQDCGHILPRPISIFDATENSISFLIRKRGFGSLELSQYKIGQRLRLFGSLGKGFKTDFSDKKCLLIGGGEGIAPMLHLSKVLDISNTIKVLGGFRYQIEAKILDYFNVPTDYTALDHRQTQNQGFVTTLLEQETEPDYIFTCGPISMMKAIWDLCQQKNWKTVVYVSMESHMACGVGACMGCTIKNKDGHPLKVCTEGPVFLAEEIFYA